MLREHGALHKCDCDECDSHIYVGLRAQSTLCNLSHSEKRMGHSAAVYNHNTLHLTTVGIIMDS